MRRSFLIRVQWVQRIMAEQLRDFIDATEVEVPMKSELCCIYQ